jgi:hypothetical protein
MKGQIKSVSLAAGTLLLAAFLAPAQGPGAGQHMRMYDPATETNFKGTVEDVKPGPMMMGTHLMVKTGEEIREVVLGPANFILSKGFSFVKGDSIEVTGAVLTVNGAGYLIAREVVKDGKTLTLRDKDGRPQWSWMRMHRGGSTQ